MRIRSRIKKKIKEQLLMSRAIFKTSLAVFFSLLFINVGTVNHSGRTLCKSGNLKNSPFRLSPHLNKEFLFFFYLVKNKHNILYDKIQNKLSAPHFSQLIFQIALKKCHVTSRLAVLQCKKEIFLNFYTAYQEKKPSPPETRSYIPSVG